MYRPERTADVVKEEERPIRLPDPIAFVLALGCAVGAVYGVTSMPAELRKQLSEPLVKGKYIAADYWSLTHLAVHSLAGFAYPDHPITAFLYGLLWELAKFAAVDQNPLKFGRLWRSQDVKRFWDLWFNVAGYQIGEFVMVRFATWRKERRDAARRRAARKAAAKAKKAT